jgi:predicted ATPase
MIYLKKFTLTDEDATYYAGWDRIVGQETKDEHYPVGLFALKLRQIVFDDITIFYGGNGSGKSTLLNLITETLDIQRLEKYNRTKMFDFFIKHNQYELNDIKNVPSDSVGAGAIAFPSKYEKQYVQNFDKLQRAPLKSKFIASDDIFKHILSVREENSRIRNRKNSENDYYNDVKDSAYYEYWGGGVHLDMEDREGIDAFRKFADGRSKSRRQFVRDRAGELQRQFSNGENALIYFDKQIEENALYLLDEPENSMSPQFQLQLKTLIEDSVRLKNCQFVIASHSPFMLALQNAKIYNLDAEPVIVEKWHQLENMKIYYDFFKLFQYNFEADENKADIL